MYVHVYTWTNFVVAALLLASMLWTQIALEKELGTCIPTVFQGYFKTNLLNAVRIWWNYNNGVLRIPTMYISVYTSIYTHIHQHSIISLDEQWHTLGLKPEVNILQPLGWGRPI